MASKHGKVAICLSGLVRTGIPAYVTFHNFFGHLDADIFYHTWEDDPIKLEKVKEIYNPVAYQISKNFPENTMSSFGNQLFGMMMANEVKKKYEIQNDFRYDLVIRTRFDLVFPITNTFPNFNKDQRTIYSPGGSNGYVYTDYESHAINDVMFWGDSDAMDIATDCYRYYKHRIIPGISDNVMQRHQVDPTDYYYSVGNMIYHHGVQRNIHFVKFVENIGEIPWREDVSHLDPIKDYDKIRERYQQV